jgi:hypothetical protein
MSENITATESQEQLSRRHFLIAGLATGTMAAGLVPETAGTAEASEVGGRWQVEIQWNGRQAQSVYWTLRHNGTFYSSDGYSGVWVRSGDLLLLSVKSDTSPAFAGTLSGAIVDWGVALQPNGAKGTWTARQRP